MHHAFCHVCYLRRLVIVATAILVLSCHPTKFKSVEPGGPASGIPELPWPPPKYSAFAVIPKELALAKNGERTLSDIANRLESAFDAAGYGERSYYSVPGGFALVSQLEQTNADATPKPEPDRWSAKMKPLKSVDLNNYIKALFTARAGYYRVIVFVVTDQAYAPSSKPPSGAEAQEWAVSGGVKLPASIGGKLYSRDYATTALIYEFVRGSEDTGFSLKTPSDFAGKMHLEKAKLWLALQNK